MKEIRLLTNDCCDELLRFQTDKLIMERYSKNNYPDENLDILKNTTNYFISEDLRLSPRSEDDVINSIAIFNELKDLDRTQANDRRLWVALTHGRFYNYTKQRWSTSLNSTEAILKRFHFEGSSLETRMRNSISRLWWAARITYDEKRDDPFELTRILWSKQDFIQNLVERSYGTYDNVVKGFLEMYKNNPGLKEGELRLLYTGLNAIGGVKVLPLLTFKDIISELKIIADYNGILLNHEIDKKLKIN